MRSWSVPVPVTGERENQSFAGAAFTARADLQFADWLFLNVVFKLNEAAAPMLPDLGFTVSD